MQKKKLLFITNTIYSFGGGEKLVLEFASRMRDRFDITIVTPVSRHDKIKMDRRLIEKRYLSGIKLVELNTLGVSEKVFRARAPGAEPYVMRVLSPGSTLRLKELIKKTDFVYQVSLNPPMLVLATRFANFYNKRLILGVHNFIVEHASNEKPSPVGRVWNSMFISTLRGVKAFHVTSTRDLKIIKSKFPPAEVVYTPNFVMEKTGKAKNNTKRFVCLYVGRFEKNQKGIDLLVEIIKMTIGRDSDIIFEIAGSGGDAEDMIENLAKRYPDNVKWLGFVSGKKLDAAYDNASLLMLTSRSETFPLTLLEGQSHGLPAIAFDISGPSDFMRSKLQGMLIPCFGITQFSDAILDYYGRWKKKSSFTRTKADIQKLVKREYDPNKIIPKVEKLIIGKEDDR